jgi:catechol 2,3-dioxygenase-like lactoylglutathione lyase family enzyme
MTSPDRAALQATQLLHCNLNVTDVGQAAAVYEQGLGLTIRMRSESVDADATQMGIHGPTHSVAWFLYDHRGGHVSPAIELVEWRTPPTAGSAYDSPMMVGMQSLMFAVPSFVASTGRLLEAGARATRFETEPGERPLMDSELLDRDGVRIELTEDRSVLAPTFSGVRLNCADLEVAVQWYRTLGWRPVGPETAATRAGVEARIQRIALPTHPFELHLTFWSNTTPDARAHTDANTRGLYRMALAVDDVRAAYEEAQQDGQIQIGEPTYVPLPGTTLGGLWVSFFRDPNGVTAELVERVIRVR